MKMVNKFIVIKSNTKNFFSQKSTKKTKTQQKTVTVYKAM